MPYVLREPQRPSPWRKFSAGGRLSVPFLFVEWVGRWVAYLLSRWSLLEVLEYCGSLSILVGVIFYFAGAHDRLEQKHYQAWQVINTAQGKGGSGGRIDAMQELNADHVPLVGIDARDAFLQHIRLARANLRRCNLSGADMRGASLEGADVDNAQLVYTNLRGADLRGADLTDARMWNADLGGADLADVVLDNADLSDADLSDIANWQSIRSIARANIWKVEHAPDGFIQWATGHGAVVVATAKQEAADPDPPSPQTVTISAAISLKEAMQQIARQYQTQTGTQVKLNFGASGTLAAQIEQGAPVDLMISAGVEQIDALVKAGLADPATRRDIAGNRLVLIVPKDFANPPSKFQDLLDARFAHIAIGDPKIVPAGEYAMQTFKSLGIDEKLAPKLVMGKDVRQVLSYVIRGEAEGGVAYATDAAAADESVKLAAVADESTHRPIVYPAIIIKAGNQRSAADFLAFLSGSDAQDIFKTHGFTPPPAPSTRD
jgi:molybdenum ABC transporter molybdate-binding protein